MRLLLVEDHEDLARPLKRALEEAHFAVDLVADGREALQLAVDIPYDAIVLDIMLPGMDGWQVLDGLRRRGRRTPVLMLTARDAVDDRIRGLDLGADDYLAKPFALGELIARLRSIIRRSASDPLPCLTIGDVTIDTAARQVRCANRLVPLTAREYAILELLARRRGMLVTRSAICDHLYAEADDIVSNAIDVHVAALRRKLGRDLIQTRRGHGYAIDA